MTIPINPPVTLQGVEGKPVVTTAEVDDAPPVRYVAFSEVPELGQLAVPCVGTPQQSIEEIANPGPQKEYVPASVAKWAFLLILRSMGKEDALKTAIAADNGADSARVRAKWEASEIIERDGATVDSLGAAVGLSPAQVDQVFRDALKEANQ